MKGKLTEYLITKLLNGECIKEGIITLKSWKHFFRRKSDRVEGTLIFNRVTFKLNKNKSIVEIILGNSEHDLYKYSVPFIMSDNTMSVTLELTKGTMQIFID